MQLALFVAILSKNFAAGRATATSNFPTTDPEEDRGCTSAGPALHYEGCDDPRLGPDSGW